MREWLVIVLVAVGTFGLRAVFLAASRGEPSERSLRLLRHVGPAVLAAITLPALLAPRGVRSPSESLPALLAAVLAWLLWRRTKSLPVALFSGLGLWWLTLLGISAVG